MKKLRLGILTLVASLMLLGNMPSAFAEDGNAKRGRVYFKMVCTVCHMTQAGKSIPPATYTMEEWKQYLAADKHDLTKSSNPSVRYYASKEYRESIKDSNKAAKKFLKMENEALFADVHAFVVSGAKDSDTPASCD